GEDVPEIMRDLGAENVVARLQRRLRQLRPRAIAEAAGRGDSFAAYSGVAKNAQCVAHVIRQLIGGLALAPAKVLHEALGFFRVRAAGAGIDDPGVGYHLGVEIPIQRKLVTQKPQAGIELILGPAGQVAVEPAHARRVGYDAVLAFDAVVAAPAGELADKG